MEATPTNLQTIWQQSYQVSSYLLNSQGKMGLIALLNCVQDAAWNHAHNLGLGFSELTARKMFWVVSRQSLRVNYWPSWDEKFVVKTWLQPPRGQFGQREFVVESLTGETWAVSSTTYVALDAETRRPLRIEEFDLLKGLTIATNGLGTQKIMPSETAEKIAEFSVRNSDIDVNRHVNNTKYAQWVLDALPASDHQRWQLLEYHVNFLVETHLLDQVQIKAGPIQAVDAAINKRLFQGVREQDGKILFTALMYFKNRT